MVANTAMGIILKARWNSYKQHRTLETQEDPEMPPTNIDEQFLDYLEALLYFEDLQGQIERAFKCCEIIESADLPKDKNLLTRLGPDLLASVAKQVSSRTANTPNFPADENQKIADAFRRSLDTIAKAKQET